MSDAYIYYLIDNHSSLSYDSYLQSCQQNTCARYSENNYCGKNQIPESFLWPDNDCFMGSYTERCFNYSDNGAIRLLQFYFLNPGYSEFLQLVVGFAIGLAFGPFSWGLKWLLIFIIVFEIIYYAVAKGRCCWSFPGRVAVEAATLLGWLVGRTLTSKPIK